ncbi:MAG TPA: CHAT domain-containing protein [Thermoanaerobaculia bacterium]|nr:CHAT domain-containing protein [Thermoanaerobaculia bacterium]
MTVRTVPWVRIAVAVATLAVVGTVLRTSGSRQDAFDALRSATVGSPRPVEGRLTGGFAWTSPTPRPTPAHVADALIVRGAAGELIDDMASSHRKDGHHAAIAHLWIGEPGVAVEELEQWVAGHPGDADAWSDLAAAREAVASANPRAELLSPALAAADQALELNAALPEARFNRALILTRLGLLRAARRAWGSYLEIDATGGGWAREAAARLYALDPGVHVRSGTIDQILTGDSTAESLDQLVRERPQESRSWAEAILPFRWAEATDANEPARAAECLAQMERLAMAIERVSGDRMALDTLGAITRVAHPRRHLLVRAHRSYYDGRVLLNAQKARDAQAKLSEAAGFFEAAGSPMALVAHSFSATARSAEDDMDGAADVLQRVRGSINPSRWPALTAQAEWEMGLCDAYRGKWTAALDHLTSAKTIFSATGDRSSAAFIEAIVSEVYDRLGQFDEGWRHRLAVLPTLAVPGSEERFAAALAGAIRADIARQQPAAALALANVAIAEAETAKNPVLVAETLVRRAHVLTLMNRLSAAAQSVAAAHRALRDIPDGKLRAHRAADLGIVEGDLLRHTDPARAVRILTQALQYYKDHGQRMLLPGAYLGRGRAALAAGNEEQALADFRAGIEETARQRDTVRTSELRVTVFDTAEELFLELVELQLRRGEIEEAFATVEWSRARTLVEDLGIAPRGDIPAPVTIQSALPPGGVVIEYAVLPQRLAIFVVTPDRIDLVTTNGPPAALEAATTRLREALSLRRPIAVVQQEAADLHQLLIKPVERYIQAASSLVIVPDRFLNAVPFAALYDAGKGRYFADETAFTIAPGAALLCRPPERRNASRALVIADPLHGPKPLYGAREEARVVAGLYEPAVVLLNGPEATAARFAAEAPAATVIHYAGHAPERGSTHSSTARAGAILDAGALSRMRLPHARLVVLAGCSTDHTPIHRVEGIPSISRAFLAAGARTVVGTLWDIDDAASMRLFSKFHEHVRSERVPSAALRAAQRELMSDPDGTLRHPATWAAATVIGTD